MNNFRDSDEAVVGIVVTVLLIGLIVVVGSMVNTVFVPKWLEERESVHMEEVSNQFVQLKYALDVQSMVNGSTAISTSITLGSKEIPIFNVGRTFGSIHIIQDRCNITIQTNNSDPIYFLTDSILFSSGNSYFIDQTYIYEAGALILSQHPANMLYGKPGFYVTEFGKNMSLTLVKISGVSGKTSATGYGLYPIQTEVLSSSIFILDNVTNITVKSDYLNSWKIALNSSLSPDTLTGFGLGSEYLLLDDVANEIMLSFDVNMDGDPEYENHIVLRVVEIRAQVAPGWVE